MEDYIKTLSESMVREAVKYADEKTCDPKDRQVVIEAFCNGAKYAQQMVIAMINKYYSGELD